MIWINKLKLKSKSNSNTSDQGIVINGVKWATRNVDIPGTFVAKPEDVGMFYQWNRNVALEVDNVNSFVFSSQMLGKVFEKSNDPSPPGWRLPTINEINTLLEAEKVRHEWITVNGVNGRKFTDNSTEYFIFLPAAGFCSKHHGIEHDGKFGYYWSDSLEQNNSYSSSAYSLNIRSKNADIYFTNCVFGISIRPVAEI